PTEICDLSVNIYYGTGSKIEWNNLLKFVAEMSGKGEKFFRFKHFTMLNDVKGLKIGTDGVLLGAWAGVASAGDVWDVGAGTGLISLMLAQRYNNSVTAFECDAEACEVIRRNFREFPIKNGRLTVVEGDVFQTSEDVKENPSVIVSNPPFYATERSLAALGDARDKARREGRLSAVSLIKLAAKKLLPGGRLFLISPSDREDEIEWHCSLEKLYVSRRCFVTSKEGKQPFRIMWEIITDACEPQTERLCIRNSAGEFTEQYKELTKDYYIWI
ncbi:MAG: methyltransferase, partial [Firmicutes bacterium]|nr:methyltransferase [Bacillota bacterium]MCM1401938.1 methyltransferase [Bacteroides sp.]MCM1477845.1 methyltransferase [Bacteroides sp.]